MHIILIHESYSLAPVLELERPEVKLSVGKNITLEGKRHDVTLSFRFWFSLSFILTLPLYSHPPSTLYSTLRSFQNSSLREANPFPVPQFPPTTVFSFSFSLSLSLHPHSFSLHLLKHLVMCSNLPLPHFHHPNQAKYLPSLHRTGYIAPLHYTEYIATEAVKQLLCLNNSHFTSFRE